MHLSVDIGLIGVFSGLAYAALALGLVLVYRSSRVVNFAHGAVGAVGAGVLGRLVLDHRWPWLPAFVVACGLGVLVGLAIEGVLIRRLEHAPPIVTAVATIGAAQLLAAAELALPRVAHPGLYPTPIHRLAEVAGVVLRGEHFTPLAVVPAAAVGLGVFLTRTPYGLGIRAAAENPDAARLAGIPVHRVSAVAWGVAGALAVLAAALVNPLRNAIVGLPGPALGPGLLVRALAAALVGRMTNLPVAALAGVGIGVGEAYVLANTANPAAADALLFVLVLALVLARGRPSGSGDGSWATSARVRRGAVAGLVGWADARRRRVVTAGLLALGAALPFVFTTSGQRFLLTRMVLFVLVALSVTLLTGWAGLISLGQVAFVGIGSMVTGALTARGMPFLPAVGYATVAGTAAALLMGLPALRVRGPYLGVVTLSFAVAAREWLFTREVLTGGERLVTVRRPALGPFDLADSRSYYLACLVVVAGCAAAIGRLRHAGFGRSLFAVRDNEQQAAAAGVSAVSVRLTAFAIAGGLAALAGALLAGLRVQFGAEAFPAEDSLAAVSMTVIGGLGSVPGAIAGVLYAVGLPAVFSGSTVVALLTSGIGVVVVLLVSPGGIVELADRVVDRLTRTPVTAVPAADDAEPRASAARSAATPPSPLAAGPDPAGSVPVPALQAEKIRVRFGGVVAVDDVDLLLPRRTTIGLIGANGAGKSTLMDAIGGHVRPESGRVLLGGVDVTEAPTHRRAVAGLGRQLQGARLYPGLTVTECILVALRRRAPGEVVPELLGLPSARTTERAVRAEAAEIVGHLGLGLYADRRADELSTGTRRVVELACLLGLRPVVLLLDEPTAGLAQREVEAYAPLIETIRAELDAATIIVEHDLQLLVDICDELVCMHAGAVIARGLPADVRSDEAVVRAYLGNDERAIARSGRSG